MGKVRAGGDEERRESKRESSRGADDRRSGALAQMIGNNTEQSGETWDLFQQFDVDGSGSISADEVRNLCKRLGCEMTDEQLQGAMKAMDGDGSGEIEYNEFLAWWGSDAGIAVRRRLTRPDATQGPMEGTSTVESISATIVERLEENMLTRVQSVNRKGHFFALRRMQVELSVSCNDLPVMGETGGNMSVFVVLRLWQKNKQWWLEHGRSETIREQAPQFCTSFIVDYVDHNDDYSNEFDQWVKIELYQRKSQMADLARHVKHGEMVFTMRSVYRTPVCRRSIELPVGGQLITRMMPVPDTSHVGSLELHISANLTMAKKGVDNPITPYFQILRYVQGVFQVMYRSNVMREGNTERPAFPAALIPPHHVAHLEQDTSFIKFEIYTLEPRGDPRCLGAYDAIPVAAPILASALALHASRSPCANTPRQVRSRPPSRD
jgi:hypothetical protein